MSSSEPNLARFQLRVGWWAVLIFLSFGIVLEGLQGLKLGYYVDLANTTRRHMWTLAHAHGTLLGVLNIVFALSLRAGWAEDDASGWQRRASISLVLATILLPAGFLLGGVRIYAGDPGLGIVLVPIGGLALLYAVWLTARRV